MQTYAVTVQNFPPVVYSAKTHGKARAEAWRDYTHAYECTFKEFLSISSVRKCEAPAIDGYDYIRRAYGVDVKVGQSVRIINEGSLSGEVGTVVYPGTSTAYVHISMDRADRVFHVHPLSVETLPADTKEDG